MRGRKPTPTAVHRLRGTFRADRHDDTLELPASTPTAPEHLDDEARTEWGRITAELENVGTLHKLDRGILATYCQLWSRLVAAEQGINQHGLIVKGSSGAAQISPFYSVAIRTARELRALAAELGLSPSSRSRLRITQPEPTSGKDRFFVPKRVRA